MVITKSHLEPVNGATVDQGWEHPKPVPEGVSNGTKGQYHMEVLTDTFNEQVVHGQWGSINLTPL